MIRARAMAGSSLLEVTIALVLLASATVGVLGAQLTMRHVEFDLAARAQAWRLADSRAELARGDSEVTLDWARASAGLPGAHIDEISRADHALAVVHWRRDGRAAGTGACERHARPPVTCVMLAYSSGHS